MSDFERKKAGRLPPGLYSNAVGYSCNKDPRISGNVMTKVDVTDDLPPERHELFLLDDGEKKVEYEVETRMFKPSLPMRTKGILTYLAQVFPTPPSSHSTKKTTPSATFSAHISQSTHTSFSQATKFRIHSSPSSDCAFRLTARSIQKRLWLLRARSW